MTTKPSYTPVLRFPDFLNEGEWEVKRLGEIITVNSGRDYKHLQSGDIPVYGTGGYMLSVNDKLSDIDAIGIGRKGTIDKPQYLKAPFWTVDTLFFLTTKEGYDLNFVFCLLQTVEWKKYSEQTGVPSLTRSTIEKIEVKIPPLAEQRRIAQALTALDELIAATNERLEQMKAYKKGLMQQLFVDSMGGGKSLKINYLQIPKLRFPEFYEEKEWIYYNGDKMFEPIVNKNHNSDLPVLAITQDQGAIPRDLIDYNVIVSDKSIEAYKVVEIGDFIISLRSFQGGIEYSKFKGLCSPAYIVLRKKSDDVCDDFYRYYFKSNQYIQDLNRNLEGIRDGKMVSYKQFSDIMIPCPKYEEQRKIASCLSAMDETINAYTEKVGLLGQYKKGLMQQMFAN